MEKGKVAVVTVMFLALGACGSSRDVATEESYAANKAEQMEQARKAGPEAIEKVEQGLTCEGTWEDDPFDGSPFPTCSLWCPDVNPGMYSCTSDPNTYSGETNFWFQPNYAGGCCQGFSGNNDWGSLNGETNDKFKSAKCRRPAGTQIYEHANFGGAGVLLYNGGDFWTINYPPGVSSIRTP